MPNKSKLIYSPAIKRIVTALESGFVGSARELSVLCGTSVDSVRRIRYRYRDSTEPRLIAISARLESQIVVDRLGRQSMLRDTPTVQGAKLSPVKLVGIRKNAGLSQSALARAVGLENSDSIRRYETGNVLPNANVLLRILLTCGVTDIRRIIETGD